MKLTATLCTLLAVGCVSTPKVEEPKPIVVRICGGTAIEEKVVRTEKFPVYYVVLPNMEVVEGNYVETKNKQVSFCSEDPDVVKKSYMEGMLTGFNTKSLNNKLFWSQIFIGTNFGDYCFKIRNEKPDLKWEIPIAAPVIEVLEGRKCSQGGTMYRIPFKNGCYEINPKQIKILEK